jgi:hypothetical protein
VAAPKQTVASAVETLPPIMGVSFVAAVLGVTAETVCLYIRRGDLAASGLGTDKHGRPCPPYAILAEDLLDFLARRRLQAPFPAKDPTQTASGAKAAHVHGVGAPKKLVEPRRPR